MKVIFLDFDGVLNSHQEVYYHARLRNLLKEKILNRLEKIYNFILGESKKYKDWRFYYSFKLFSDHFDFCPIACSNVQHILDKCPDVKIVVSSIWKSWGLKYCKAILKSNGIDPNKVIGLTSSNIKCTCEKGPDNCTRGHQIQAWLDKNKVEQFVIIDDDADMIHLIDYLYQTNGHHGLQFDTVLEIIKYFNEE